jgi:bla regulator protein blaR1
MAIILNHLDSLSQVAAAAMLNTLLAGIAIALLAWAVTRLCARQGAGTRFAVWLSALFAVAALPLLLDIGSSPALRSSATAVSALTLPASLAIYLLVVWLVGAAFGILRVGLSLYRLARLRSTCNPVDLSHLDPQLQATLAEPKTHRRVTICVSNAVRVPAAVGYFRPRIVFPTWTLAEIPTAELNAILIHELAHLRRWDDWTNLAQKIAKALFFFHPAVWFIEGRLSLEREMACDDAVLAADFSPRAYAESLVGLAEKSFLRRGVLLAQAAVSHIQQLKLRLAEILRRDRGAVPQESTSVWKPAVALMAVAAMASVYGASQGPRLVAFSGELPKIASFTAPGEVLGMQPGPQLHAINLRYEEAVRPPKPALQPTSATRVRTERHVAPTAQVALAQPRAPIDLTRNAEVAAPSMFVLSNFPWQPVAAAPSAVLVVMQGEQFNANGPVFWQITIVHLTESQQRISAGGVPKKI